MTTKKILNRQRVRKIEGGFSFIPHRFITGGFLSSLCQYELLLYFFLILVADRNGVSFYSYHSICNLLELTLEDYLVARDGLVKKDLIAFENNLFQVLELPAQPVRIAGQQEDSAIIAHLVQQSLKEADPRE
jgi:hypothetical protein